MSRNESEMKERIEEIQKTQAQISLESREFKDKIIVQLFINLVER